MTAGGVEGTAEPYIYIWEYRVKPGSVEAFLEHYAPAGRWVELFRRADGYLGTDLLRDRADPDRYVTIDRWASEAAFASFRTTFREEFDALDRRCESFTHDERQIGTFAAVAESAR